MNRAMNKAMSRRWQLFSARIDALGQRERVMAFGGILVSLVAVAHLTVLGPLQRKQEMLRAQVAQQQDKIDGINAEIVQKLEQAQADPDAPAHMRLEAVRGETERLGNELRAMQRGLVPPERIAPLLEAILRANGRLKLVSVRTLPVDPLSSLGGAQEQGAPGAAPAPAPAAARASELLFRHGVELTVRGSYLDMVDYMSALESLPTQLFWGKAQLEVEHYPSVRLTLTLYTLSLDEKWMKL
jgi:MSHA biogenesis protein MshJ